METQSIAIDAFAGAGGSTLGLIRAGCTVRSMTEENEDACNTLRMSLDRLLGGNAGYVYQKDARQHDYRRDVDVTILHADPPAHGKGAAMVLDVPRFAYQSQPAAVMIAVSPRLRKELRTGLENKLRTIGYEPTAVSVRAELLGVPQRRKVSYIVAMKEEVTLGRPFATLPRVTLVGDALGSMLRAQGWQGIDEWMITAGKLAPRLASRKRYEASMQNEWVELGIDWRGLADEPPARGYLGNPRLTPAMLGTLQGFPENWCWSGSKRSIQRQVGGATPPACTEAVARMVLSALGR